MDIPVGFSPHGLPLVMLPKLALPFQAWITPPLLFSPHLTHSLSTTANLALCLTTHACTRLCPFSFLQGCPFAALFSTFRFLSHGLAVRNFSGWLPHPWQTENPITFRSVLRFPSNKTQTTSLFTAVPLVFVACQSDVKRKSYDVFSAAAKNRLPVQCVPVRFFLAFLLRPPTLRRAGRSASKPLVRVEFVKTNVLQGRTEKRPGLRNMDIANPRVVQHLYHTLTACNIQTLLQVVSPNPLIPLIHCPGT